MRSIAGEMASAADRGLMVLHEGIAGVVICKEIVDAVSVSSDAIHSIRS